MPLLLTFFIRMNIVPVPFLNCYRISYLMLYEMCVTLPIVFVDLFCQETEKHYIKDLYESEIFGFVLLVVYATLNNSVFLSPCMRRGYTVF